MCNWPFSNQGHPAVAYAYSQNAFLVSWRNQANGIPSYISTRRVFAGGGIPPGEGFTVASGPNTRDFPEVACNLKRNEYLVDDSNTPELNAAVSRDDTGRRYLLTRQSGQNQPIHEIWAHMAYPNESLDQVFNIVWRGPSQNREYPAIGGGRSNYLVGWEHQRYPDTNRDIHGHVAGYVVFLPFIQRDPLPKQVIVDPPGSPPNNRGEV